MTKQEAIVQAKAYAARESRVVWSDDFENYQVAIGPPPNTDQIRVDPDGQVSAY
jgi:hypothetical protein